MSAGLSGRRKCSMEESNQRFKMCLNVATARKLNKATATDDNQRYRGNWMRTKALAITWKHGNLEDVRP